MHLTFAIPQHDAREFAGLPEKTRDRVTWLLDVMKAIATAGKGRTTTVCQQIADTCDPAKHFNSIYQPWKRYSASGDWRALVDKRHTSEFWIRDESKKVGLPADFITEWKSRCEQNQRAFKPAWRILIRD